jgi:hypothetical protein
VGKEKEAELWAAARQFVQRIHQVNSEDKATVKMEGDQETMEVD